MKSTKPKNSMKTPSSKSGIPRPHISGFDTLGSTPVHGGILRGHKGKSAKK